MGYYITIQDVDWLLPRQNEQQALMILKQLNKRDDLKRGGAWSNGGPTAKWFSWMPEDYDKTSESVADVLKLLGFEVDTDETGTRITWYDSKTGQEDVFLNAIAHLVEPGSYIVWRGEDGAMWKNVFDNGNMETLSGKVTFEFE